MERPLKSSMRWLGALAALSIVVAACGPGADSPATPAPGAATPAPGAATPAPGAATPAPGAATPAPGDTPGMGTPAPADTPAAGTPGPDENLGGSVSIIGTWTDAEQESFLAMLAPWRERTGVQVDYVGTRDMQTQLTAAIEAGGAGLPDVAGIPGPGLMQQWFERDALKPLDFIDVEAYRQSSPALADLGIVDGQLAGIFVKAAVKGFIWYANDVHDGSAPDSWEAVMAIDPAPAEALWCVALESGGDSGWPGTDWIEDILIRQSGPEVYDQWVNGELEWTSPEMRSAFDEFARVLEMTYGGSSTVVTTAFQNGGNGLFTDPRECKFHHQASFMSDFLADPARAGADPDDFDFFVMPDINPEYAGALTGGGDLFGMFNDTEQARSLIEYLVSAEAQEIWAARGGFIAANTEVPLDSYADAPSRKSAETLQQATAMRFDASDVMPGAMRDAFHQAMMSFAQNPGQLDSILQNLESVRQDAY